MAANPNTPERVDARALVEAAVGTTVFTVEQEHPNHILRLDGDQVVVGTGRSPAGQRVPLRDIQDAADRLMGEGEIRITPSEIGYRSAFVGAILATHPAAVGLTKPARVRLKGSGRLRDVLQRTLDLVAAPRASREVRQDDPFYRLVVEEFRDEVAVIVGDSRTYKTQGSVGRGNLANTPWVAVFDLNETDTATQGIYVVYLIRGDGAAIYLSLNQGTTSVQRVARGDYEATLEARSRMYAGFLDRHDLTGFLRGRVDLGGGNTFLTPGYEAGNIAAITYPRGAIPAEERLHADLRRMLTLYEAVLEEIDQVESVEEDIADPIAVPAQRSDANVSLQERRRLGWHRRAEGRNQRAAKAAKDYHGYRCQVCDIDYEARLGTAGRRCIDAHHLVPFAQLDERPRALNPVEDFAVVCATCHRLLHTALPPLSIDAARALWRAA
jgi:5-methylcytosine-specific restriction enzyme A